MAHLTPTGWLPSSQSGKDAVLEQLERLFGHAAFKNSKRNQALLRYVVERHLEDPATHLKERTLGIEVFGRGADYDTTSDPIVRIVAGEVRRRIAQYYYEPGHEAEVRIELPSGSYTPEFHLPAVPSPGISAPSDPLATALPEDAVRFKPSRKQWLPYAISAFFLTLAVLGIVGWRMTRSGIATAAVAPVNLSPALNQFWGRMLSSASPVQLVMGTRTMPSDPSPQHPTSLLAQVQASSYFPDLVGWRDLVAASRIIGFLQQSRKDFSVEDARTVTINNLARGPSVLVGGFNNPWVMTLSNTLRFHFTRKDGDFWIVDRKAPAKQYMLSQGPLPGSIRDFALIARLTDAATGHFVLIVAGIGAPATMAGSNFVTDPIEMNNFTKRLPSGWESKNVEALISVQAIHGEPGAPHIVAVAVQ